MRRLQLISEICCLNTSRRLSGLMVKDGRLHKARINIYPHNLEIKAKVSSEGINAEQHNILDQREKRGAAPREAANGTDEF